MPVEGIKRLGRSTQGVIVMRLRGDEQVSSLAPVVESEASEAPSRRPPPPPVRPGSSRSPSRTSTRTAPPPDDRTDDDDE